MTEDDWTATEDAQLVNAVRAGDGWSDIADMLLRERAEVIARAAVLQRAARDREVLVEQRVKRLDAEAKAARVVHPTVPVPERVAAVMEVTSRPLLPPEPEPEPVVKAPPPRRRSGCAATYEDMPCCLVGRHRGDHLTEHGVIFSRDGKSSWRDVGDVYLVMVLNNGWVAAKA